MNSMILAITFETQTKHWIKPLPKVSNKLPFFLFDRDQQIQIGLFLCFILFVFTLAVVDSELTLCTYYMLHSTHLKSSFLYINFDIYFPSHVFPNFRHTFMIEFLQFKTVTLLPTDFALTESSLCLPK